MPPESTHKTLSKREIAILAQWIETAPNTDAWEFIEPLRPKVPSTKSTRAQERHDHFVYQRIESEGIAPAAEADKENADLAGPHD